MSALLLECWRSGQIDPADMVRLCRDDPALEALLLATGVRVEVKS